MKLQQLHVMEKSKQQRTLRWGGVGGVARGQGTGQRQEETGECSIPEGSERGGSHTPLGQVK